MALIVDLTNVVREYRIGGHTVRALNRVTLRINGGEFTSIVGPSGAGKSTLLQLLGALDSPDSGSIQFNGTEIATMTDEQQSTFRRHQVGLRLPVLQPPADPDGVGERRRCRCCSTGDGCARCAPTPSRCSTAWGSATGSTIGPPNCPAGRCNGWPWREP